MEFKVISFKNNRVFAAGPLEEGDAKQALNQLIHIYCEGQKRVLPFILGLDLGKKEPDFKKWYSKIEERTAKGRFFDPYIDKADELGVFTTAAFDEYVELASVLEQPLLELFADYPL